LFNETTEYWHYVAVSYVRQLEHETLMYVFIDDIMVLETSIFDWFSFTYTYTGYYFHIGKDFPGVVRKAKVNARPYCLNSKSLWINTDASTCNLKGSTNCYFCDLDETSVLTTSTYDCFVTCADFGYYYSSGNCHQCHGSCRYCYDSAINTDCKYIYN
jgi:hypothetical protein